MATHGRRVFCSLTRYSICLGIFANGGHVHLRSPSAVRALAFTPRRCTRSRSPPDDEEEASKPIKFSTSKASHRSWTVDRSMGSNYQRPWWKVLPVSAGGILFLLWCCFRGESEVDAKLEKELYEHLPGLVEEEEEEEVQPKAAR